MPVMVRCSNPGCGKAAGVSEQHVGRTVKCPHCARPFVAQAESATVAVPVAAMTPSPSSPTVDPLSETRGDPPLLSTPPRSDLTLPTQIGRFRIRDRLGAGAFGTVYRAHDPHLDREVALKVPRPEALEHPQVVERFLREARAAARLRHPNIVPVYEAGQDASGFFFIASAYIPGETLAHMLRRGPLEFRKAAKLVRQLAEALAHAHEQGIVHRDVKPSNVMVDARGDGFLMDFGLAHQEDASKQITQQGAILGTVAYMAPEQAMGKQGETLAASDQYSLGVLLYEALCGEVPFTGRPEAVLYQSIHSKPPAPRSKRPDVPPELEAICMKALAKAPAERFASCQQMADYLKRWLDGEPLKVAKKGSKTLPPSPAPAPTPIVPLEPTFEDPIPIAMHAPPPSRKGMFIAGSVAVALAVVGLAIWGAWALLRDEEKTPDTPAKKGGGTSAEPFVPAKVWETAYLPDGCYVFGTLDVAGTMGSPLFARLTKEAPQLAFNVGDIDGISLPNLKRLSIAVGTIDTKIGYVMTLEMKNVVKAEEIQAGQRLRAPETKYREVRVGTHTVYERLPDAVPRDFVAEAFAVPEAKVVLMGNAEMLRQVLGRQKRAEPPASLKNALSDRDARRTLAAVADARELIAREFKGVAIPDPLRVVKDIETVVLTVDLAEDLQARATAQCRDQESAADITKQIDAFLTLTRKATTSEELGGAPPWAIELAKQFFNKLSVSQAGKSVRLDLTLEQQIIATFAREAAKEIKPPVKP